MENFFKKLTQKFSEIGFISKDGDFRSEFGVCFSKENLKYNVFYDGNNINLGSQGKVLSSWSFGNETTAKDGDVIISDFCNVMDLESKKKRTVKKRKERSKTVDVLHFFERLCSMLPYLKNDFNKEKDKNGEKFRVIWFCKKINMEMSRILSEEREILRIERIFKFICNVYMNGDERTKCIVSIGILGKIAKGSSMRFAKSFLPTPMKKVLDASLRVKV
jgi:hypothetical protein